MWGELQIIGINSSRGKEGHVQQVAPGRQPAIVSKITKRYSVNRVKLFGIDLSPSKENGCSHQSGNGFRDIES